MLSIGLIGAHQEKYYTELSREDYYTEGGEPPGEWCGQGAEELGLVGVVEGTALSKLFQGFDPSTGQKLVKNAGSENRRAGFDFTFNAPKSVSVLFSQVGDEHRQVIQEAQAAAVRAALRYVEEKAVHIRLGRNGAEVSKASLVAALFEHSTARLVPGETVPDPHLHTHAVIANLGITEDGRTRTLDSRELLRHKMAAGVLYRTELLHQLERRLGLTASRRDKWVELDLVPKELMELFSKRRKAIEAELGEGAEYGKATDAATLHTRTHKPAVDRPRFFEEWKKIGLEHGFSVTTSDIEHALSAAPERRVQALVPAATERAVAKVTSEQSHFAEREFVRALADELEGRGVSAGTVLDAAWAYFQSKECLPVGESKGERRFTTREVLNLERRMLSSARELSRRSHRVRPQHSQRVLRARESQGTPLSAEQERAFPARNTGKGALARPGCSRCREDVHARRRARGFRGSRVRSERSCARWPGGEAACDGLRHQVSDHPLTALPAGEQKTVPHRAQRSGRR